MKLTTEDCIRMHALGIAVDEQDAAAEPTTREIIDRAEEACREARERTRRRFSLENGERDCRMLRPRISADSLAEVIEHDGMTWVPEKEYRRALNDNRVALTHNSYLASERDRYRSELDRVLELTPSDELRRAKKDRRFWRVTALVCIGLFMLVVMMGCRG